ncbi:MAG: hypothetical protein RLZZ281_1127 [Pseudomonadota bacterium]
MQPVNTHLYLASQSPRRRALLESVGITPIVLAPDPSVDAEALETPIPNEAPLDYVARVARLKRDQALERLRKTSSSMLKPRPHDLILSADTTVALGNEILGKPATTQHAKEMLEKLAATTHQVHTCVSAIRFDRTVEHTVTVSSQVTFAPLSAQWIDAYVASGEPMDKAGAYGIQGIAGSMIPHIAGSYTGIMGLPLYETLQLIRSFDHGKPATHRTD